MGRWADQAFSDRGLRQAWAAVLANDAEDGVMAPGVARFQDTLDDGLGRLVADLAWGAYEPRDLTVVILRDGNGGRQLLIPPVRDRVVERAVLDAATPLVDPHLGPSSFAYRPGLGVADAVRAVVALREEGLAWVARTDVNDCFPSIPVALARRMFAALVDDPELLRVVDLLLARPYVARGGSRRIPRGLPQGCALSPLLANLVLTGLDDALTRRGFPVVRYADDLAIGAASSEEAWEAVRCAADAAEELGMSLGPEDTHVMSFDEGFAFLGEDFGPRYPPAVQPGAAEPDRKVLYVGLQSGRVRAAAGRLVVESADDATILDVPGGQVSRVVCFGAVGFSAGARSWALNSDVDVVFASRRGSYLGTFVPAGRAAYTGRLRNQLELTRAASGIPICRAIVEAKITKQVVLLKKFTRRDHADLVLEAITSMTNAARMLPDARTADEVMGLEGAAAAAYFPTYGALLPDGMGFDHRSRQPPLDISNSALSFLYTVLLGERVTALYAAGLDPSIGVLHGDDERRPSLALDLMEELRPMVVDQVVLEAARQQRLKPEHGRSEDGRAGVLLTRAGRDTVLDGYEHRMLQSTRGALPGFAGTIRRHLYRQAQRLQAAITDAATDASTTGRAGPDSPGDDRHRRLRHQRGSPPGTPGRDAAVDGRPGAAVRLRANPRRGRARRSARTGRRGHRPGPRLAVPVPPMRRLLGDTGMRSGKPTHRPRPCSGPSGDVTDRAIHCRSARNGDGPVIAVDRPRVCRPPDLHEHALDAAGTVPARVRAETGVQTDIIVAGQRPAVLGRVPLHVSLRSE